MFKACVSMALVIPCFVVNLVSEAGSVNDGERDAGSFFVQFQFYSILATVVFQSILRVQIAHQRWWAWFWRLPRGVHLSRHRHPFLRGLSFRRGCSRRWFVLIAVVNLCRIASISRNIPVPEAPQTIKQNWIPFLTFFFRRILICGGAKISTDSVRDWCREIKPQHGTGRWHLIRKSKRGCRDGWDGEEPTALNGEDMVAACA